MAERLASICSDGEARHGPTRVNIVNGIPAVQDTAANSVTANQLRSESSLSTTTCNGTGPDCAHLNSPTTRYDASLALYLLVDPKLERGSTMPVFAVIYHYDPDKHDLRMEKRPEHRALLNSLADSGTILAGGAWADDGAPGAILVAQGPDKAAVEAAFDKDPYHTLGVIAEREIRQWAQLFGPWPDQR